MGLLHLLVTVMQNDEPVHCSLRQSWGEMGLGSLAFVVPEDALYLRGTRGWRSLQVGISANLIGIMMYLTT